jgi:predicted mannosyl-3-phosphoglycerate phosphatase (HAD superfamily)
LAWLGDHGRPDATLLIISILADVPYTTLERAARGDLAALEEVATRLWTRMHDPADPSWPQRANAVDLAILREWLQRAAAKGSGSAKSWLAELDAAASAAGDGRKRR